MNLKPRFLLLTVLLFVVTAIPLWFAVRTLAESIVEQWAVRYAEKQVLYDKSRTLQPILREVALSRQMAYSPYLVEWAHDPDNAGKRRRALAEMERFRQNFADHSYFVGLLGNGHYYHNNAKNEFKGQEFRYVLNKDSPKDAWFFDLVRQQQVIHINVNPDPELGITKLWIDVLIRDGTQILTDHHALVAFTFQGQDRQQIVNRILHVRPVIGRFTVRDPPQAQHGHHVVNTQRPAVLHVGAQQFDKRLIGARHDDMRIHRRQAPVLPQRAEDIRRRANRRFQAIQFTVTPGFRPTFRYANRQITIQANRHFIALAYLPAGGKLAVSQPLQPEIKINVITMFFAELAHFW